MALQLGWVGSYWLTLVLLEHSMVTSWGPTRHLQSLCSCLTIQFHIRTGHWSLASHGSFVTIRMGGELPVTSLFWDMSSHCSILCPNSLQFHLNTMTSVKFDKAKATSLLPHRPYECTTDLLRAVSSSFPLQREKPWRTISMILWRLASFVLPLLLLALVSSSYRSRTRLLDPA